MRTLGSMILLLAATTAASALDRINGPFGVHGVKALTVGTCSEHHAVCAADCSGPGSAAKGKCRALPCGSRLEACKRTGLWTMAQGGSNVKYVRVQSRQ